MTKKILKIAGIALLVLAVFYVGLVIMVKSLGQGAATTHSISYNIAAEESGVAGALSLMSPSAMSNVVFKGEVAQDMASSAGASGSAVANSGATAEKKVIRTGSLSLKVEKTESAAEAIANIAKINQGEVANSNFYESSRGVKAGSITVRVPFNHFTAAFTAIKKVATQVLSESTNAQDITAEYIDLEACLKNKRAEEASFLALLNRSGKMEEILAVTKELAAVRGEIEQLEGQQRYLDSQTDMSTITANISEDVTIAPAADDWRPWQVVKNSVKQLLVNGQNFVDGLIGFLVVVLPALIVYALVIWLLYYLGKKAYRRFIKK
ncbi:MAG: DUF4349 domain-containing protein [Patescibacteria group bacterium]|nr:DUF4349 domain-containing protein [Patescibacteria group bacterium]